jgi:hypothetical protein
VINWTINAENRQALFDKIAQLDPTRLWQCTIIEKKSKRTLDQNARLFGYVYKAISDNMGLDIDEVHQLMGYRFLRYQKEVGGLTQTFVKSTTKLDTKEMAEYQDNICRWASECGVYIE